MSVLTQLKFIKNTVARRLKETRHIRTPNKQTNKTMKTKE